MLPLPLKQGYNNISWISWSGVIQFYIPWFLYYTPNLFLPHLDFAQLDFSLPWFSHIFIITHFDFAPWPYHTILYLIFYYTPLSTLPWPILPDPHPPTMYILQYPCFLLITYFTPLIFHLEHFESGSYFLQSTIPHIILPDLLSKLIIFGCGLICI